jgi:hypothetical protein
MNKFLMSVALLTAATLTVDAAGKPGNGNGNGGNKNSGGNNGKATTISRPIQNGNGNTGAVGPKPITLPKNVAANNSNGNNNNGNKIVNKVVNKNNQDGKNDKDNKQVLNGGKFDKDKKDFKNLQVLNPKLLDKHYHLHHAKKFTFGFCYQGNVHQHWSHRCFFDHYGCHCNWCPASLCWYYWCAWDNCWYPVSHCPYGRYVF